MADYKIMYNKIFNAVTDAERQLEIVTDMLRTVQQECEEIFMQADETPIKLPDRPKE